jgi:lipopolysaccharide export system protein LptC
MRFSSARLFPLLLMLTLALLSFWLERLMREEPQPPAKRRHDPDYMIEGFTLVEYNRVGMPVSTLSAAKMLHFPDDDSTDLLTPRAVHTKPAEPRLTLSADRGTLSQDGNEMFLYDNVLLLREGTSAALPGSELRTNFLHVVSQRSLVRSDREVQITEPGRKLSARGMEYDNQAGLLTLYAQVRGVYGGKLK